MIKSEVRGYYLRHNNASKKAVIHILNELMYAVTDIKNDLIGEAVYQAYNYGDFDDSVYEIFVNGLSSIEPRLVRSIKGLRGLIKNKSMRKEVLKLSLTIRASIELAQERIDQYYYNGYNQVQLCEEGERELEAVGTEIKDCINDFKNSVFSK